jgi:hypothetical protein
MPQKGCAKVVRGWAINWGKVCPESEATLIEHRWSRGKGVALASISSVKAGEEKKRQVMDDIVLAECLHNGYAW